MEQSYFYFLAFSSTQTDWEETQAEHIFNLILLWSWKDCLSLRPEPPIRQPWEQNMICKLLIECHHQEISKLSSKQDEKS